MPTVVVAGPADWRATAHSDAARLHARIGQGAAELARGHALAQAVTEGACFEFEADVP